MLELKAGDDISLKFTITDSDGAAIDLTGGTINVKIAPSVGTSNNDAIFYDSFTTFTDPTNGISVNSITDTVSKDWTIGVAQYQVQFVDSGGLIKSESIEPVEIKEKLIDNV